MYVRVADLEATDAEELSEGMLLLEAAEAYEEATDERLEEIDEAADSADAEALEAEALIVSDMHRRKQLTCHWQRQLKQPRLRKQQRPTQQMKQRR